MKKEKPPVTIRVDAPSPSRTTVSAELAHRILVAPEDAR